VLTALDEATAVKLSGFGIYVTTGQGGAGTDYISLHLSSIKSIFWAFGICAGALFILFYACVKNDRELARLAHLERRKGTISHSAGTPGVVAAADPASYRHASRNRRRLPESCRDCGASSPRLGASTGKTGQEVITDSGLDKPAMAKLRDSVAPLLQQLPRRWLNNGFVGGGRASDFSGLHDR